MCDLSLQNVKREQSGIYTCVAHNIEGDGVSNPVNLNIKCKLLCSIFTHPVLLSLFWQSHKVSMVLNYGIASHITTIDAPLCGSRLRKLY